MDQSAKIAPAGRLDEKVTELPCRGCGGAIGGASQTRCMQCLIDHREDQSFRRSQAKSTSIRYPEGASVCFVCKHDHGSVNAERKCWSTRIYDLMLEVSQLKVHLTRVQATAEQQGKTIESMMGRDT